VFWRIVLFYILAILIIGLMIPYTDPHLLNNGTSDVSQSPFTLLFSQVGIPAAADVMNVVVLTAVLSAGTSGMYASTRMLYSLALEGKAPALFRRVSGNGVPLNALYVTTLIGALCFLSSFFGEQTLYTWLLNTSSMCGFIAWTGIAVSHYRFRRGFVVQGMREDVLPYRARWFPFSPLFAGALCVAVMFGQNYAAFTAERIDWSGLAATYISLPLFLAIWLGYRWRQRTRFVSYAQMDVSAKP
jgi:lysine-specific permease